MALHLCSTGPRCSLKRFHWRVRIITCLNNLTFSAALKHVLVLLSPILRSLCDSLRFYTNTTSKFSSSPVSVGGSNVRASYQSLNLWFWMSEVSRQVWSGWTGSKHRLGLKNMTHWTTLRTDYRAILSEIFSLTKNYSCPNCDQWLLDLTTSCFPTCSFRFLDFEQTLSWSPPPQKKKFKLLSLPFIGISSICVE